MSDFPMIVILISAAVFVLTIIGVTAKEALEKEAAENNAKTEKAELAAQERRLAEMD